MKINYWKLLIGSLLVACCLLFVVSTPVLAKSATDISVVSNGARSVAMGRSGVALAGKENNAFVNPASIASVEKLEFTSMSTQVLGMVDYKYAGGAYKMGKGTVAVSYVGAASPAGYYATDENSLGAASGSPITYGSSILALAYGVRASDILAVNNSMGNMLLGANLKYYSQGFSGGATGTANGMAVDLGLIMQPDETLSLGLNLSNALSNKMKWDTSTEEELQGVVKAGITKKIFNNKLLLAADADFGAATNLHGGLEWLPVELLALRAGADQDNSTTNLTAGVGINLKDFSVDLAYRKDALVDTNSNFYVSLSYSPYQVRKIEVKPAEKAKEAGPAGDYMDLIKSKTNTETQIVVKTDESIKQAMTKPYESKKEASTASAASSDYYKSLGIYNK